MLGNPSVKQSAPRQPEFSGERGVVGHIIRQKEPENLEFPFSSLTGFQTPIGQFYIRSHFPKPNIQNTAWRLNIEGHVQHEVKLSLDDLKKLPVHTRAVTLECAGNGRVFLIPKQNGAQWELGAVSTAEWTGAKLSDVLALAGMKTDAMEVVLEGADEGRPDNPPIPPKPIRYARSIPLSKIEDAILAYQMNGQPLPSSHGAPLRAVVGGWYGMASVKWLNRIIVTDKPFQGYFQTVDYAYWDQMADIPVRLPMGEMKVKAQIARPGLHEIVPAYADYRIVGAAWTGDSQVTGVEVSTDGGEHFAPATLLGESIRHAWRFWEFHWKTPSAGACTLLARATDARGQVQPNEHQFCNGNYIIHHALPIEVTVR